MAGQRRGRRQREESAYRARAAHGAGTAADVPDGRFMDPGIGAVQMRPPFLLAFSLAAAPLVAQVPPEHFEDVRYIDGHASYKPPHTGWLVMGDSALEYHECFYGSCSKKKDGKVIQDAAQMVIPYRKMTDVSGATERHGASVGSKMLLGAFASERRDESVTIAFDSETSAEAPVFQTKEHESAQLVAKIKFKLRKLGLIPSSPTIVRDSTP